MNFNWSQSVGIPLFRDCYILNILFYLTTNHQSNVEVKWTFEALTAFGQTTTSIVLSTPIKRRVVTSQINLKPIP